MFTVVDDAEYQFQQKESKKVFLTPTRINYDDTRQRQQRGVERKAWSIFKSDCIIGTFWILIMSTIPPYLPHRASAIILA